MAQGRVRGVRLRPLLLLLLSQDVFANEEARVLAIGKFRGELARTDSSKLAAKKAASSLAKAALAKGSRDNVTVVRRPSRRVQAWGGGASTPAWELAGVVTCPCRSCRLRPLSCHQVVVDLRLPHALGAAVAVASNGGVTEE
jgi:hypothetical protein